MSEQTHRETEKLFASLLRFVPAEEAKRLARHGKLSAAAGDAEKGEWVRAVSAELDGAFSEAEIVEIRAACHCDEEGRLGEMKDWLRGIYLESPDIAGFVARMNALGAGWHLEGETIVTRFTTCECHMLKAVERLDSPTWCQCTAGYTNALFTHVFGRPVETELRQSIKTGADACLVAVRMTPIPT